MLLVLDPTKSTYIQLADSKGLILDSTLTVLVPTIDRRNSTKI